MHDWMNTRLTVITADTAKRQHQHHWMAGRELTDSDLITLITILSPLFNRPIISIIVQTDTEFTD